MGELLIINIGDRKHYSKYFEVINDQCINLFESTNRYANSKCEYTGRVAEIG